MNIINTFDATVLSDLNGKLTISGPPNYKQDDFTSLLSVRAVEDIFVVDGKITLYEIINDTTINEHESRNYVHKQFNNKNEFMLDFNSCFVDQNNKSMLIMSIEDKAFRIAFQDGYEKCYLEYEGNVQKFIGKSTQLEVILDGTLSIDSIDNDPLKQILLTFTKQKIDTAQQFVDIVNTKFDKVIKLIYNINANTFNIKYLNDKVYKKLNHTGNVRRYLLRQSNRILNNEKLEDSVQLNIKYLQIKCDQLECGMSSYVLNPENGKLEAQFGSNVLQVLCPNQMSYQSKNMDLHIKLLQNMPLNFYIQDQNNVDVDVQYILQMRFYKQDFFQQQSDSGVTAIERHTKKQLFVYLSEDNRQFKINRQFNHIAIGQAYGDIGIQEQAKTFISSYIYNLNINEYKFDILHAYKYNIENLNNSVFVWKQVPSDCLLRFDLQIYATEYDQYTIEKQQRLKTDQKPNILLRLFVK
ncbi:Hypothetical_protein [Hexamita inflata]|uniref:Hypothetical_protein n=1 Tax=Hexamita inflata TaxID=28002 RepID=A0AA86NUJ7_9EUKA|nr:Hypothetical protein HINF_LOCUS12890 [Hexamita inflata]